MSHNFDGPALADALMRSQHRERELRAEVERLRAKVAMEQQSDAESLAMYRRVRDERDALAARLAEAKAIIREYRDQRAIYNNAYDAATVARCNAWLAGAASNETGSLK